MEDIICCEASLINLKHKKLGTDKEYEREKANLEEIIKKRQLEIALMKQKGCEVWQFTDADDVLEKEVEEEYKRWKNLTPEEKMKEHKERMETLRKAEKQQWYGELCS